MKLPVNANSQCNRIMAYLQAHQSGMTTLECVKELDVLRPGARVCELRQRGHHIVTRWTEVDTPLGRHKIANYVLTT